MRAALECAPVQVFKACPHSSDCAEVSAAWGYVKSHCDAALATDGAGWVSPEEVRGLVEALRGLLRDEWMTYEGNLEATGHASVDDLNKARDALAVFDAKRGGE